MNIRSTVSDRPTFFSRPFSVIISGNCRTWQNETCILCTPPLDIADSASYGYFIVQNNTKKTKIYVTVGFFFYKYVNSLQQVNDLKHVYNIQMCELTFFFFFSLKRKKNFDI